MCTPGPQNPSQPRVPFHRDTKLPMGPGVRALLDEREENKWGSFS
jgi:hypothetical protein